MYFDTVTFAMPVGRLPFSEEGFRSRLWQKKYDVNGKYKWTFKENKKGFPHLSFFLNKQNQAYLVVSLSLPSFFYGNNAKLLTQDELLSALKRLSVYVTEKSGVEFEAENAIVWKIHFTIDIFIGEENINAILDQISKMNIPYFEVAQHRNSSVYFHSKGGAKETKKPRTIYIYGKHADSIAKKFPKDAQSEAYGKLRIEFRYNDRRAIQRLSKTLNLPSCEAKYFLRSTVSEQVLQPIEKAVFSLSDESNSRKIRLKLIEIFGAKESRKIIVFLDFLDNFGKDFFKIKELGFSESNYYSLQRQCREVGIWSLKG
jgi:uncharacterized protein with HEPN domain